MSKSKSQLKSKWLNTKTTLLLLKSDFCPLGFLEQPWVGKKMVNFTAAGKKSPVHISIFAELNVVRTMTTL